MNAEIRWGNDILVRNPSHTHPVITHPTDNMARSSLSFLVAALCTPVLSLNPSPGCGSEPTLITPGSTTTPIHLTVNNRQRQFFVSLPDNYNSSHPYRLILTLHALGGTASQVVSGTGGYLPFYGLPPLVAGEGEGDGDGGAIFVAPDGLNNGWANQGGEDVAFLREAMAAVEADVCVDRDLRFSTGFSYGAAMSYSLACSLGREMRAVAALSGNDFISGCDGGSEPVAYYGQHGTRDSVLPVSGGRAMRDRFVRNNGCSTDGVVEREPPQGSGERVKIVYEGCQEDKPVVWVLFDGDHTPTPVEAGAGETWTPRETWEFFRQFQ